MAKETVRYPDALVARVETVVAEAEAFESKSEFYRFASDFLLSVLDPEHDPTVLGYGDILAEIESTAEARLVRRDGDQGATTGPFLDAYIQVRRHLLYDDVEAARAVVADRYDATDREALLLDEVIGRARRAGRDGGGPTEALSPAHSARSGDVHTGSTADAGGTDVGEDPTEQSTGTSNEGERGSRRAEATQETDGGTEATFDAEDD